MNKKPNEKPIFLYIVIGILTVAVIALAAVSFLSLNHLVTLQQKVQTLSKTVEEISTDANTLISQADQLDELREQVLSRQPPEKHLLHSQNPLNPLQNPNSRTEHFPLPPTTHLPTTLIPAWTIS